ncbi:MAG: 30S ribosomal protein S6 [Clostridia bacterium]|nr:30S ribosomal protein S6 [Clostridia bacterium]
MIEVINKYETIFVIDASLEEEKIAALVEKFKSLISGAGEIESVDEWGKRRLAYPINDLTEGYYVLINFSSKPDFPQELERIYRITDGILRDIVIKKEEKRKISK